MARLISLRGTVLQMMLFVAVIGAMVCVPESTALAQHGGGHAGGGGHFSGGGGMGAPHMSAPPAPHFSAPARMPGPPAARSGTHTFVAVPPPSVNRPIIGNRVTITPPQPIVTNGPHVVIGFPPSETGGRFLSASGPAAGSVSGRESGALSFSGEGHEIWRNAAVGAGTQPEIPPFPVRPIFPRRPIFRGPVFGSPIFGGPYGFGFGFGAPGFGLGWGFGWGLNSWFGPSCGPYWGFGCDAFSYYDYGYGNYGDAYSPGSLEGQIESQGNGSAIYENDPAPAPLAYGGGERQLVQLYLKDGRVYDVTDYWLVNDNDLHFTTVDASGNQTEHVIGFDQLDMQKTIDVNTNQGYRFVLRNQPLREYLQGTGRNTQGGAGAGPMQLAAPNEPSPPPQPNSPEQASQPE
jgi:hypothetical protein